jgi:8-oxo-dGDP phosphatase
LSSARFERSGDPTRVLVTPHAEIWSIPVTRGGEPDDPFVVMARKDAVSVCAFDPQGAIALVRQHRFAADVVGWEIPQGSIEADESALDAAAREFSEEVGCVLPPEAAVVGRLHEAADWCTTTSYVVVARNATRTPVTPPRLESGWFFHGAVDALIARGEVTDAVTVAALTLARRALRSLSC